MEWDEIKSKVGEIKGRASFWSSQAGSDGHVRKWYEEVLKESGPEIKGFKEKTRVPRVEAKIRETRIKKLE